ncbi:MAG: hypothetical protein AB7P04_14460, partial [Bacteriovoracia bacterium]
MLPFLKKAGWLFPIVSLVTPNLPPSIALADDCPDTFFLSLRVKSKGNCEAQHQITVGAGVSSPSVGAIFAENPTGLIYNRELKFHISAAKTDGSAYTPWRYNFQIVTGNGDVGGGIGTFRYTSTTAASAVDLIAYGAGVKLKFANLGIGVSGFSTIQDALNLIGANDFQNVNANLGMIYNPEGNIRIAGTIFDFLDQYPVYAAGIAAFPGGNTALNLDFGYQTVSDSTGDASAYRKSLVIKPAIGVATAGFQFTASYGYSSN